MKIELSTTKEKLVNWLEVSQRIARQNASRTTVPSIETIWLETAAEIGATIVELKTGQTDLMKK